MDKRETEINENSVKNSNKKDRRNWLYAFAVFVVRLIFKPLYRYRVIGKENLPKNGRFLYVSNHISELDPIFLALISKRQIHYMAKQELFKIKIFGVLLKFIGTFPVERGTGGASALDKANEYLNNEKVVGIFIEGTRSKNGELLKPKTGVSLVAYRAKTPVIPISIASSNGKYPKPFGKVLINIGKAIEYDALDIQDSTGIQLRKASRIMMAEIKELYDESRNILGVPIPAPVEKVVPKKIDTEIAEKAEKE